MSELPDPLTPADCDLRGYDFMPLFGHRLFGSDLYDKADGEEFRIAVKLWWEAWNQCPAGSLPNDERRLCKLADLGRDMKAWAKVRETVLHGFVLCSDDRLYHTHLSEWAIDAYARRVREKDRKRRWREGRNADGDGDNDGRPHRNGRDNPQQKTGTEARKDVPKANGHSLGDGQKPLTGEDRTGQDRRGEDSKKDLKLLEVEETSAREGVSQPETPGTAPATELVGAMAKLMFSNYPPRAPQRTVNEQREAVAPPAAPRPKPSYFNREQINAALRKTA
jgi:Protein of unknown function (DUF1376)